MNTEDLKIIAHLRQDSRRNLTKISRHTLMPISTIFERIKKYNKEIITKSTVLVDFKKLGYNIKVNILVKVCQEKRESLKKFLESCLSVNSVYRINNGFDYFIEAIFKDMLHFEQFNDKIDSLGVESKQVHYVLEEIKREEFISQPDLVDMIEK